MRRQHDKHRQKKMKKLTIILLLLPFLVATTTSCEEEDVSDENMYTNVSRSITSCISDIYNQNLAGNPTGSVNITAEGPLGGTVILSGSGSLSDNGLMVLDFSYELQNVKYIYVSQYYTTEITLTGTLTEKGSFKNEDYFKSVSYKSSNMHINGSIYYTQNNKMTRDINLSGDISINAGWSTTNSIICGYTVSY